jgi:adenylyl-sulfate kinase
MAEQTMIGDHTARPATVFWLTGLSGAGKTTLAMAFRRTLESEAIPVVVLDGDDLRTGLNSDLGFSDEHRRENARRIAHVAKLIAGHGSVVIVAAITPRAADRELARAIVGAGYIEVFVKTSLSACEARDPKGLYRKARDGSIKVFTGVSAVYEPPVAPDILINTEEMTIDCEATRLFEHLRQIRDS